MQSSKYDKTASKKPKITARVDVLLASVIITIITDHAFLSN